MAKNITGLLLVASVVLVSACTRQVETDVATEEFVIIQPEPVSVEPVFTGKYK